MSKHFKHNNMIVVPLGVQTYDCGYTFFCVQEIDFLCCRCTSLVLYIRNKDIKTLLKPDISRHTPTV